MLQNNIEKLVENFALFDDWEERYRYLIDLGRTLPHMEDSLKTDENKVRGCTSQVWMVADIQDGKFHFTADSDAHIVRGLIALLISAYQDVPVKDMGVVDIEPRFKEIGLDQHLSPNRRSGFFAMVERIKELSAVKA